MKMKRLVSYSSSSSESTDSGARKKIGFAADDDPLADPIDSKAATLTEMGCSPTYVAHAIKVCGGQSSITELLDFIQACQHDSWNDGHESHMQEVPSSVEDLKASYGKDQASCSKHNEMVLEGGLLELTSQPLGSPCSQLQEMGCSPELAVHAINVCGKGTPIPELLDYIQACQHPLEDESCALECPEVKDNMEFQLREMGFREQQIKCAFDACGRESNILVLADFIQAHFCNEGLENPKSNSNKVDSSEDESDVEPSCITELKSMGFSLRAIEKAMTTCESHDIDMLLAILLDNNCTDSWAQKNVEMETKGKQQRDSAEQCCNRSPCGEAGSSKKLFSRMKWTKERRGHIDSDPGKEHNFHLSSDESDFSNGLDFGLPQEVVSKNIPSPESKSMGFGTPRNLSGGTKPLPDWLQGPPFFYFTPTNVPKNDWDTIHRHFDILPEFVDLKFFSACQGHRGCIHNLPVCDRKPIQPAPPMSICEALPHTRQYWPWWDKRERVNSIIARRAGDKICSAIADAFVNYEGMDIPDEVQQQILRDCNEWNLIWVAPGQVAPLEPNEVERLLGFNEDHTRGCTNMIERYEVLGHSLHVNLAAFHLSALKTLYPEGIRVLSIYPGIGGAEVALHKLGIVLKTVVFVGVSEKTRNIITSWWKKSGQKGEMKVREDVNDLTNDVIAQLIDEVGCIDLIIGGSPLTSCLTNTNGQTSRKGSSNATQATWFFEFPRILRNVKAYL